MKPEPKKELAYYLTIFTLQGHTTWRAHLHQSKDGFAEEQKRNWGPKPTRVTKQHTIRIDRITGAFQPLPE